MLFNLDFATNTVLSCFPLFFLFIDLCFLIPVFITQIFNAIGELVIAIGFPTKEAKAEMETSSNCRNYNKKVFSLIQNFTSFYAFYSLIHFDLFLQLNNLLFRLFFQFKFFIHFFLRHDFIFSDTLLYY